MITLAPPPLVAESWWEIVQGTATVAAVLVSLWVLYLQRRDLGLERSRQSREQANALMVDTRTETRASGGGYELLRSHISLLNTSNRPVRVEGLSVRVRLDQADEDWGPWASRDLHLPLGDQGSFLLRAGESHEWEQPDGCHVELNVGASEFAVVTVRDADNNTWERRTDTYQLRNQFGSNAPAAVWAFRGMAGSLLMQVGCVPYWTLFWLSLRAVRRQADRTPWSLSFLVALTGDGFEAGRADPWHAPQGDGAEIFLHGYLLDPGPMWGLATEDERDQWRQTFEEHVPNTWPLGAARKRDLFRVIWRSWTDEHAASPLGWIRWIVLRRRTSAAKD